MEKLLPPEKTEAVIYVLPSSAIAFWIVTVFISASNLTEWLAFVGLLSAGLSVFGSLVPFDVYFIRKCLRNCVKKKWKLKKDGVRDSILQFNIYLQSWENSYESLSSYEKEKKDYLTAWADYCIADSVSSYPGRARSWYWRLSLYATLAMIILVVPIPFLSYMNIDFSLPITAALNPIYSTIFIWSIELGAVAIILLTWYANKRRDYHGSKDFSRDVSYLAEFEYLQYLVVRDCLKKPDYYKENMPKRNLKNELESLQTYLYSNDWSMFTRRWTSIRQLIQNEVNAHLNDLYFPSALSIWLDYIKKASERPILKEQMKLLLYFFREKPSEGFGKLVIEELLKEDSLQKTNYEVAVGLFSKPENLGMYKEWRRTLRSESSEEMKHDASTIVERLRREAHINFR